MSDSPPPLLPDITTCIVGGGSSAHVLIAFLSECGHRVHLLTRRPDEWHRTIECQVTTDGSVHRGTLDKKSSDPSVVIPDADCIVLCMPVHQYRPALNRLAPFINRHKSQVFVGTIYGQAGFNWMVHTDVEKQFGLQNIVTFAVGQIPFICRTKCYGSLVTNYGGKQVNTVAVTPQDQFEKLNRILLQDMSENPMGIGKFKQACSFLSLTMSVDNQIIHPARCYGLWLQSNGGVWSSAAEVPFFYRDFDVASADILTKLDADYSRIRHAIRKRFPERSFPFMLSYLELENLNHASGNTDLLKSLKDSVQLSQIKTPTVPGPDGTTQCLDTGFRFFTDDIAYGLLVAKWIAEQLCVSTPTIDEVIWWAQTVRGESFLDETCRIDMKWCLQEKFRTGIPPAYGITSLKDILD